MRSMRRCMRTATYKNLSTYWIITSIALARLFLNYAGLPAPADMQGRSFRPLLQGKRLSDWRQSMYYRYWMHLADHGVPAHYGVRTKRFKLVYYYGQALGSAGAIDKPTSPEWELFDLDKDPHEMNSVYDDPAYAGHVKELKLELDRLEKQVGDKPA